MQHERVAANASDFSCVLKVLPVLVGHVLEDVLASHGQNSGQHLNRVLVANVQQLVNGQL